MGWLIYFLLFLLMFSYKVCLFFNVLTDGFSKQVLGMIQKLRNPFLRHFSLGTPPFPLHNFLADQWVVL